VGFLAWLAHNAKRCLSEALERVINWSVKSTKTFGHAFLKHGGEKFKKS